MEHEEQKGVKNNSEIYEDCKNCGGRGFANDSVEGIWICLRCHGRGKVVWTRNIIKDTFSNDILKTSISPKNI